MLRYLKWCLVVGMLVLIGLRFMLLMDVWVLLLVQIGIGGCIVGYEYLSHGKFTLLAKVAVVVLVVDKLIGLII